MWSDSESTRTLEAVLDRLPLGTTADARLTGGRWRTVRFANGAIHQPMAEDERTLSLRVAVGSQIATATSSDLTRSGLDEIVERAVRLARVAPAEPRFPGFPANGAPTPSIAFAPSVARSTPEAEARRVREAIDLANAEIEGARVSGVLNAGTEWMAIANTSGLGRRTRRTAFQASVLVERPEVDPPVSGWSETAGWDLARLDMRRLAREAVERVPRSEPRAVPPGAYRVLLGGSAVSELFSFLGYLGFGGHPAEEGWGALNLRRGRRIAPEELTVVDDGRSPDSLPTAIDFEGRIKRRTPLIDAGIAGEAVTDLVTGGRLGRRSTGHALPPESPWGEWGPVPSRQLVRAGPAPESELVKTVRRGLWVTRFHYVRVVHPGRAILTGMTRDGTYLIERGEVAQPVRNLRFTESILSALGGIELLGRERGRYCDERGFGAVTCPALVTRRFRFTSATLF